jgi:hypothetical protein
MFDNFYPSDYLVINALYNVDKKELFAVVVSNALTGKYIFPIEKLRKDSVVAKCRVNKTVIKKNTLGFRITIRKANTEQIKLLENNNIWIKPGYPQIEFNHLLGFTFSAHKSYNEFIGKMAKYNLEKKRIKENK